MEQGTAGGPAPGESHEDRFWRAIARIDDANAEDPNRIDDLGGARPAELVYSERMTRTLARLYPDASELLGLAARAQHIRRWTVPRSDYPQDRIGYRRWRNELKHRHAEMAGRILADCGYREEEIARVGSLIRKEHLKTDPEAQALEDVVCLVFLEHYFADFSRKHEAEKLVTILRKTWTKMSDTGQTAALALPFEPEIKDLIERALAGKLPPAASS